MKITKTNPLYEKLTFLKPLVLNKNNNRYNYIHVETIDDIQYMVSATGPSLFWVEIEEHIEDGNYEFDEAKSAYFLTKNDDLHFPNSWSRITSQENSRPEWDNFTVKLNKDEQGIINTLYGSLFEGRPETYFSAYMLDEIEKGAKGQQWEIVELEKNEPLKLRSEKGYYALITMRRVKV